MEFGGPVRLRHAETFGARRVPHTAQFASKKDSQGKFTGFKWILATPRGWEPLQTSDGTRI